MSARKRLADACAYVRPSEPVLVECREDVPGYLFWTRHAAPFAEQLRAQHDDGIPWAVP